MGKISPISVKYNITAKFTATGVVEKPDVIGAVFGQTEGLLGEDLELRELQKNGKIGRIDVNLENKESKTSGEILIPTSLDKAETTIIAAALETIERIGPCDAKVSIEKIEDVRGSKREFVISRAKKLLEQIREVPESREIENEVREGNREARIIEYGKERLPAGPDMDNKEIIVVEGRADVLNLLRCGIKNVISMNGTYLPKTIKEISEYKSITLFVDGDRGGILISKDAIANANIDFVVMAPEGKEVEELTNKEVLKSLRNKRSVKDFMKIKGKTRATKKESKKKGSNKNEKEFFQKILYDLTGTKTACLIDSSLKEVCKVPISELTNLYNKKNIYAIIMDGTATPNIIKTAEKIGCSYIVAKNFVIRDTKTKVNLISV